MKVRSSVFATFILLSEVIGIALFLRGFFPVPVKSSLASNNRLSDLPAEPLTGELTPPPAVMLFINEFTSIVLRNLLWATKTGAHQLSMRVCGIGDLLISTKTLLYVQEVPRTHLASPSPCLKGWW